ncbi:uncharacterized protein LOC129314426 [Prosopis cineraria]|uniref:uncharacterized protein LOC129314426 n=1 Tax=Prosopis cineraria TaxID=364024 RepID=UPI002410738B|nr:uncharacterized protein LOC129314426 [Prosopis cineraria]
MLLNRISHGFCHLDPNLEAESFALRRVSVPFRARPVAFLNWLQGRKNDKRRSSCTADELHYVPVSDSDWKLSLWRYLPSPQAPTRNHPLLLLSGVATNAIGYDLSPESSFARFMSAQGFDTWTLEVRGSGLSMRGGDSGEHNNDLGASFVSETPSMKIRESEYEMVTKYGEPQPTPKMMDVSTRLSNKFSDVISGDLRGMRQNSTIASQIRDLKRRLQTTTGGDQPLFPAQVLELQERLIASMQEFQEQLELVTNNDWDFDHYLEEDVPAAMEYIRNKCQPKDGKVHAIGHSMGGILLYATLSRCRFLGKHSGLASVVTLASSLDYSPSRSSLKLLLPLAEPAQALKIPVIPVGPILAAVYPLANYPPYALSWLNYQISAQEMDQKLFQKLVLNNFCTIPSKLLLQLKSVFEKGGLCDRSGTFFYKEHLPKSKVPILAVAGDQDLICPPEAVYETAKLVPEDLITYKVFGEPGGPHYAHYDLVGGRKVADQVYPCLTEFLIHHDMD